MRKIAKLLFGVIYLEISFGQLNSWWRILSDALGGNWLSL